MPSIVCFDAHIIIWGIRNLATLGQEEKRLRAKYLIDKCEQERKQIIVPSIVVAELLAGIEPDQRNDFISVMYKRFIIPPFDTQAAMLFSNIWHSKKHAQRGDITRAEMKADYMIVAIAKARGAECIYTEDDGLKKFATGHIDIKPLPIVPPQIHQGDFFD
jgi:predicted nucleic acid-binding protein